LAMGEPTPAVGEVALRIDDLALERHRPGGAGGSAAHGRHEGQRQKYHPLGAATAGGHSGAAAQPRTGKAAADAGTRSAPARSPPSAGARPGAVSGWGSRQIHAASATARASSARFSSMVSIAATS